MASGRSSLGRIDEGLSNWQYVVLASQIMHIIGISLDVCAFRLVAITSIVKPLRPKNSLALRVRLSA